MKYILSMEPYFDLLKQLKSIKKFQFVCRIPLEDSTINELFAGINHEFIGMDEICFDCQPLPFWNDYSAYYWDIESIAMEFDRQIGNKKLLLKPLKIMEHGQV